MRFAEPFLLLLLLLIPILSILYRWSLQQKRKELEEFFRGIKLFGKREDKISFFLMLSGIFFLVLALARPQIGVGTETMKMKGADIIFLLDASLSMSAEDINPHTLTAGYSQQGVGVKPNRFKKAKEEVVGFLDRLEGDRAGLVIFAHAPVLISPLTTDYRAVKSFLDTVEIDLFTEGGTSIERALDFCIPLLRQSRDEGRARAKVIVLIGDGEDTKSNLELISQRVVQKDIRVYTIGVGLKEGDSIPIFSEDGSFIGYKEDYSGNRILTRLEESTLINVSSLTGGRYYRMGYGREIKNIISDLKKMKRAELGAKVSVEYEDRFQYFLLAAFFLIFAGKGVKIWKI